MEGGSELELSEDEEERNDTPDEAESSEEEDDNNISNEENETVHFGLEVTLKFIFVSFCEIVCVHHHLLLALK